MSIVLTILGLLAVGGLTVGGVMVEQQQLNGTKERVTAAQKALTDYFAVNGRLPCPARMDLASANGSFGTEINCASTSAPDGTWRVGAGSAYSNGVTRIGALPVRALGLRDNAMSDEYGNRIWYAVTESFTRATNIEAALGALTILDGSSTAGAKIADPDASTGAVFTVFSTGPGGKGNYRYQTGAGQGACSGGLDAENCDRDAVFRDARFNNGSVTANFFDDLLLWVPKYLLTASANTTSTAADPNKSVQFNNNGFLGGSANFVWDAANNRVGIGTSTPSYMLHLTTTASGTAASPLTLAYFNATGAYSRGVVANLSGVNGQAGVFTASGTNGFGIHAKGQNGTDASGYTGGVGVFGSGGGFGVVGQGANYGTYGYATNTAGTSIGVYGSGAERGVHGYARNTTGDSIGVYGYGAQYGVYGYAAASGAGVRAYNPSGSLYSDLAYDGYGLRTNGHIHTVNKGAQLYNVMIGATPPGSPTMLTYAYESIGVTGAAMNLRLQSPGSIMFHTNMSGSEPASSEDKVRVSINANGDTRFCVHDTSGCTVYFNNELYAREYNSRWSEIGVTSAGDGVRHIGIAEFRGKSSVHGQTSVRVYSPVGAIREDWKSGLGGGLAVWDITGATAYFDNYETRSDRRYKKDIAPLDSDAMVEAVMKLKPSSYHYKLEPLGSTTLQYGFIAQEVRESMPNLVSGEDGRNGRLGLNYDGFIAPLVATVQALKRELDEVKQARHTAPPSHYDTEIINENKRNKQLILMLLVVSALQFALWMILVVRMRRQPPARSL